MKSKIFLVIIPFFFLFLIPFSFGAGGKQVVPITNKGPSVFFPSVKYEFTPVADGIEIRHDFIVQNKGDQILDIKKVKTE
jgi:hypothetical protein